MNVIKSNIIKERRSTPKDDTEQMKRSYKNRANQISTKIKNLTNLLIEESIPKDEYLQLRKELDEEKARVEKDLLVIEEQDKETIDDEYNLNAIIEIVKEKIDFNKPRLDKDIVDEFIKKIMVKDENSYDIYFDFYISDECQREPQCIGKFIINFDEALAYRRFREGKVFKSKWTDISVTIYS